MEGLSLHHVTKAFGSLTVLKEFSLDVRKGEFFSLLGPSGCGKTTLLRIVAGFEEPTSGTVELNGQSLLQTPAHRRPVNTVFQSYALFPHMNVFDNIAFGLRIRKTAKEEIETRVREMLDLVNLPDYARRSVDSLSGGERQRIALARALVNRPEVLLLDEPLGALDLQLKRKVQFEIKEIHRKIGATFIYVTHDQEEALALSDRIAVMMAGRIEQIGTPWEVYDRPASRFVARFIGSSNLLEGTVTERSDSEQTVNVDVEGFGMFRAAIQNGTQAGAQVGLLVRPEKIQMVQDNARAQGYVAVIEETLYLGPLIQYRLRINGQFQLLAVQHTTAQRTPLQVGQKVRIRWAPEDIVVVEK